MTNRDRILRVLARSRQPLDDDQLSQRAGVKPRQTVNITCRQLAESGEIRRIEGCDGKIVNVIVEPPRGASTPADAPDQARPGASGEQQVAEAIMLKILSVSLGTELRPRTIPHPSGPKVEVDGADEALTVLVECWAHQGPAKSAQKLKLVNDAAKLQWISRSMEPSPDRLIICVSDPTAIKHLQGASWQAAAIAEMGVTFEVVELPPGVVASLQAAQKRQYR